MAQDETVSTDQQFLNINNILYWSLLSAVNFEDAWYVFKKHHKTAFGQPNGNGAWKSLISWYETSQRKEIMTRSLLKDIESLLFSDSGSQTMGGGGHWNKESSVTQTLNSGPIKSLICSETP